MKSALLTFLFVVVALVTFAQGFPGTDSLRSYNRKYITNNPATAFVNHRLNTLLAGIIDWLDTARVGEGGVIGVDTIGVLNDSTIRYRDNGVWVNKVLKGVYDHRRKVDSAYAISDTSVGFVINGALRAIFLHRWVDTAITAGSGVEIYKNRTGDTLVFKSLIPGYGINITGNADEVVIEADTSEVLTPHDLTTAISIPDTRIPFGNASGQPDNSDSLKYSKSTNRFNTGTGNFSDSVLVGIMSAALVADNFPLVALNPTSKGLMQLSGNSYIKNQYSVRQVASSYYDSSRMGNLILSARAGEPTIYSGNRIWYMTDSWRHIFSGWRNNHYATIQFTTFNPNQFNRFSGVINAFNYQTSGVTNKPLVISTSGFQDNRAGDIILSAGRVFLGDTITDGKQSVNYNIILDPSNNGEVQMTRIANFQHGWKTNDSVSSATTLTITVTRAVWIFTGSSTATWTLPALSGNTDVTFFVKNKGSADIVLTGGTNEIYSSAATTTFNITAGQGYMIRNDGTNWTVLNN